MAEFENQEKNTPSPQKPKLTVWHLIAIALIGIFTVLTLSNLNAILTPIKQLSSILAPITVGLVLAYILNFFLRFFEYKLFRGIQKRTLNRALSMLASYVLLLLILAGFLFLIIPAVLDSVEELRVNAPIFITGLIDSINDAIANIPFLDTAEGDRFLSLEKILTFIIDFLSDSGNWIFSNIALIAGGTLTVLKNIVVGIFISIYVLLSKERLNAGCRRLFRALFSKKNEDRVLGYLSRAHSKFGGYLIGKLVDSMMVMLICMLLFNLFNIPFAILIAVIIGVTDIIPFFGPFLGAIPSAIIIFIADPWKALVFVLLILVVQQIDGNLVAPVILGDRTGLSSLGVIVAVTVMGGVFGIVGMLIGVPLFALVMTVLDDFVTHRLKAKGEPTSLRKYYPADAFIRPQDEDHGDSTLTKRFVRWVRAVETEKIPPNAPRSLFRTLNRGTRRTLLAIGRSFKRLFAITPTPEDRKSGIYLDITRNGIPTTYTVLKTLLLAIPTLLIYPLYVVEVISQSINVACRKDGKRTWGVLPFVLLSIFTLGAFTFVWHCKIINRMKTYCDERDMRCSISKRFYLCWSLIALPILIGPIIATVRFLRAFREIAQKFNATHTFPLSEKQLAADIPMPANGARPRKSIIEQIIDPDDDAFTDTESVPD